MPDPTEVPFAENELPENKLPQQPQYDEQAPQQPQYDYQQSQYNYQQPQQPQYGYQQPNSYQQTQQPQYGYQQPNGYQQPQQPQYGYQQAQPQYGWQQAQQPYSYQPAPYRQPQAAAPVTHKKAIGSMIMMIIALTFLAYPLIVNLINNFDSAFSYGGSSWIYLINTLCTLTAVVLMLVGAIIGSRGHKLFGIGLLVLLAAQILGYFYPLISMWDYYEEGINVLLLLFSLILLTGTLLAGIGCLARVKALKIVGGILMLVNWPVVWLLEFGTMLTWYGNYRSGTLILIDILDLISFIFICIAVLCFPIRKPTN